MSFAEVDRARGHLHQGAIYDGVPMTWYPRTALTLRPRTKPDYSELVAQRAMDDPDAFHGDDWIVLAAKRRPVAVLSPRQELRHRMARVLALYSYRHDDFLARARVDIEAGRVAPLVHVESNTDLGWDAGVISLSQVVEIPTSMLEGTYVPGVRQACSLTDDSLALLLARFRSFLAVMDRRPAN
jgi:hypothetical protein